MFTYLPGHEKNSYLISLMPCWGRFCEILLSDSRHQFTVIVGFSFYSCDYCPKIFTLCQTPCEANLGGCGQAVIERAWCVGFVKSVDTPGLSGLAGGSVRVVTRLQGLFWIARTFVLCIPHIGELFWYFFLFVIYFTA